MIKKWLTCNLRAIHLAPKVLIAYVKFNEAKIMFSFIIPVFVPHWSVVSGQQHHLRLLVPGAMQLLL